MLKIMSGCDDDDDLMMSNNRYRVKQCLPPHGDVEGDVEIGLVATSVELHIPERKVSFSQNIF